MRSQPLTLYKGGGSNQSFNPPGGLIHCSPLAPLVENAALSDEKGGDVLDCKVFQKIVQRKPDH